MHYFTVVLLDFDDLFDDDDLEWYKEDKTSLLYIILLIFFRIM